MFALIAVCAPVIWEPMEVEAVVTRAPRDVEAELVLVLIEVIAPEISLPTFALIAVCEEVIDEAKEVDADSRSESVAKEPEDSDAEVRVLPPKLQMSEADGTEPRLMSVIARSRFVEI